MDALHMVHVILDNPGRWVTLDDHFQNGIEGDRLLLSLVRGVLNALQVPHKVSGMSVMTGGPPQPYRYPIVFPF